MNKNGFISLFVVLIVIAGIVVVAVSILVAQHNSSTPPSPSPLGETERVMQNNSDNWKRYTNIKYSFNILYPASIEGYEGEWEYLEHQFQDSFLVGFRPKSITEDYVWTVNVYTDKDMEELINDDGNQFENRSQSRENIILDNQEAILVTTRAQLPDGSDWEMKRVFMEYRDKVYAIGNGAMEKNEFRQFYESFRLR